MEPDVSLRLTTRSGSTPLFWPALPLAASPSPLKRAQHSRRFVDSSKWVHDFFPVNLQLSPGLLATMRGRLPPAFHSSISNHSITPPVYHILYRPPISLIVAYLTPTPYFHRSPPSLLTPTVPTIASVIHGPHYLSHVHP